MKVLFITSSRLGDAILSTSVLHYLESTYPHLDVTVVCGSLPSDLFRSIPFCRDVIVMEKKSFSRHWFDLWKKTYAHKWDKVIDLRGSLLSYFLKTRRRIRWEKKHNAKGHQVERLKRILNVNHPIFPKLWLNGDSLKKAKSIFQNPTLALAPTANWIGKQWPSEHFVALLKKFLQTYPDDHEILLVAAPHEGKVVHFIQQKLQSARVKTLLSENLDYVACCISQCDMFLGNDSGLMHMAAALGVPTIGLFGPSDETRYGPYGPVSLSHHSSHHRFSENKEPYFGSLHTPTLLESLPESDYHILRTPESLAEIEKLPGFSYSAPTCYMTTLSTQTVWDKLHHIWETMHAKIDQLADIPLRSKSQSMP